MLRNQQDLEGFAIGASDGHVGHVKDLYFDDDAWVVRYLVVETGAWLASRKVLISPMSIHDPDWLGRVLPVSITMAQVKDSPDIDTDKPVSRQHEMQYLGYYAYPNYWGGAGLWGGGMTPYTMLSGWPGYVGYGYGDTSAVRREAQEAALRVEEARHRDDDLHLQSCKAVIGYHIEASDGEIGHVEGLLMDEETWAIRYIVVNTSNWWLGHQVLISPRWIKDLRWPDRTVTVDLTREAIRTAPPYDAAMTVTREFESRLHEHYGRRAYWGAAADVAAEV